ncbi:cytochrome aa3-600 menaquinol oxidase subunit 2 [Bacillus pakistanensis]|uniref:Quinol oxidase subunit 2 n=1 Tax=Rossellomorea pakistanensis TaxID=992288 RepID=A0ABS2NDZ7_9BACI|nr:cytochrome aa3 quinol oxidase subunit II [Bacillus pakistanensis]MBM7586083.1 cytochrome aa3-600 menaquinol oxidase subunit 2 [Bacillus pakistanensis]
MKMKWALLFIVFTIFTVLSGCELAVLDPKGPVAQTQADVIKLSMWTMAFIVLVVTGLFIFMLTKYRASKADKDYEPPHIEGSKTLEIIWVTIPVLIVAFLSVVTVQSTYEVEATPKGYEDKEPLIIYASSSNWKWHFSYPEENIETVNYVNIPIDRPVEFKLYSHGTITSLWIPQLGGQKYAMSDMVNTLHLLADVPGSYMGRNSNFNGAGFAEMQFEALAMTQKEYDEWVSDVKSTADKLTKKEFDHLLEDGHIGRKTFNGTHQAFYPAPEGENAGHHHGSSTDDKPEESGSHDEHQQKSDSHDQNGQESEHSHH